MTSLTVVLGTALVVLLGLFFTLINREYRHTFFSIETGGQLTRRNFIEDNDVTRCDFFGCHESQWTSIRPKVEAWVRAGWKSWEKEKPEWFTDAFKASVPEAWIPKKNGRDEEGSEVREEKKDVIVRGGEKNRAVVARAC
ncbi:hypothetical protein TrLO_g12095 [Triparma laevis f. longispina]|uniref:Uncharacterized protein n=1 Tax=Triparma laevis f. longispina TaxID=1714387 RepID=A0A9W7KYH5_9STRA|nr:hypothetical protein TrLO_g12095 [Triparma laevis f. longispina]